MLAYSRRSLLQRSIIFAPPSQRRATTLPRPKLTGPRPPSPDLEQRYIRWVTSFAAGFSIYFFLDNPWHVAPAPESDRLSAMRFTPCRLIHSEESGPNSKLLEIAIPPHLLPSGHRDEKFKSIWSVFVKDDDIQVERPYTPLNGIDDEGRMLFWIKKYPKGEVGRWLHSKNTGDKIELRGPLQTWPWKDDTWDDIVMISGGTGITPFVQLFNTTISKLSPESPTRFTLLHSSRRPEELPPAALLNPLTAFANEHPERFGFHVFVDEDHGSKSDAKTPPLKTGRIDEEALVRCLTPEQSSTTTSWVDWLIPAKSTSKPEEVPRRTLFLVCGPEPMIGAIAGPYGRNLSQGPVGGVLQKLGYDSSQVYKL